MYLAGFTDTGQKDGRLHVTDVSSQRSWVSRPGDAGCERDFHLLEVDEDTGSDPLAIESFFGRVESRGKEAIDHLVRTSNMPVGELRKMLIEFLGTMAVRIPGFGEAYDRFNDRVMKGMLWYLVANEASWNAHVEDMRTKGKDLSHIPYEEARDFLLSEDYSVTWDQNTRWSHFLNAMPTVAQLLDARRWTLVSSPESCPDFVCSDRPLTVCWEEPGKKGPIQPALGLAKTIVMFPINRRSALLGMFDRDFPMRVATPMLVGLVNLWTASCASKHVYSASPDFAVFLPSHRMGTRADLLALRRQGPES